MTITHEQEPTVDIESYTPEVTLAASGPRHARLEAVSQKLYERYMNTEEEDEIPFAD